jgi:hypothetical protein
MSSPNLHQGFLGGDVCTSAFPETDTQQAAERGADAALTARAIVVVTLLGSGFWYLLWKTALHFLAGH